MSILERILHLPAGSHKQAAAFGSVLSIVLTMGIVSLIAYIIAHALSHNDSAFDMCCLLLMLLGLISLLMLPIQTTALLFCFFGLLLLWAL